MEAGTWQLVLIVVLIFISAFLSASETALLSLSKIRLRHMVEEEVKGAYLVQGLLDDSSKVVITILIGDNISNVAATALGAKLAIERYGYGALPVSIAIMAVFIIIFGEMIPKTLASQHSEPVSLFVARPINAIKILLAPIVFLFQKASSLLILILGGN
ncbi:MAG: CNNM domain-containing protein, partial [Youngiibacter sp.]|nr:CNNM domain-containing protein [Youngiibacter sp.]